MSRKRSSRRRLNPDWSRPRVRKGKKGFFHAPKSTFFGTGPVRLNRRHRRRTRHNPFNLKATFSRITNKQWLTSVASLSGGIVAGLVVNTVIRGQMGKVTQLMPYSKYSGALNIVIGSLMVGMGKKKMIKEAGVAVAAVGLYDLVSVNVQMLGLPVIGDVTVPSLKGSYAVPVLPVSRVASVAGSYGSPVRSGYSGSYQAPDMVTEGFHGDNSPYEGIDF